MKRGKGKPRIEDKNITIRRFRRFQDYTDVRAEHSSKKIYLCVSVVINKENLTTDEQDNQIFRSE